MHEKPSARAEPSPTAGAGCPVHGEGAGNGGARPKPVYDVYGREVDPTNNMPKLPQTMAPGQTKPLPTERVRSTIPKGGTDETWLYPSEQQFYNALHRKGKADGVTEDDMDAVIRVHNTVNEKTWRHVLEWESLHASSEPPPVTLSRFTGRPQELSPLARLRVALGHAPPYDRHDWIVDRDGREVRYVIDYYHDEARVPLDRQPRSLQDVGAIHSTILEVRPALDSLEAAVDRFVRMPLRRLKGESSVLTSPPLLPSPADRAAAGRRELAVQAEKECARYKAALDACTGEADCRRASLGLVQCMGGIVCPAQKRELDGAVKGGDERRIEAELGKLMACMDNFLGEQRRVRERGGR